MRQGRPPRSYALDGSQLSERGRGCPCPPGCCAVYPVQVGLDSRAASWVPTWSPWASHCWLVVSFHVQMRARPQAPGTMLVSCGSARGEGHAASLGLLAAAV